MKYDTSNAISYKSRSNQTSHSSPFSDNKSSRSFVKDNDHINILANQTVSLIERVKTSRSVGMPKTFRSDEPYEKIRENSNNELNVSFPMFFSQLELIKKDQVIDNKEKSRPSGFYAKARNRLKSKNSQLISKNVILFRKMRSKTETPIDFLGALAKRLQLFINDVSFYQEGFPEKSKPFSCAQKIKKFFVSLPEKLGFLFTKKDHNLPLDQLIKQSFHMFFFVLLAFYTITLPINVAFKILPSQFIILDVIFLGIMGVNWILSLNVQKKPIIDYRKIFSLFRMATFFSYIFSINDFFSLCFLLFSLEEIRFILDSPKIKPQLFWLLSLFQGFFLFNSLSCIWVTIGNMYFFTEINWYERHNLQTITPFAKYLNIFNYIMTLPFSKEYNGSIFEQIFSIIVSFLAIFMVMQTGISFSRILRENIQKQTQNQYFIHIFLLYIIITIC